MSYVRKSLLQRRWKWSHWLFCNFFCCLLEASQSVTMTEQEFALSPSHTRPREDAAFASKIGRKAEFNKGTWESKNNKAKERMKTPWRLVSRNLKDCQNGPRVKKTAEKDWIFGWLRTQISVPSCSCHSEAASAGAKSCSHTCRIQEAPRCRHVHVMHLALFLSGSYLRGS